ncbi:hypothetical protein KC726_05625 [Candidatus Woesebacteria bacterium]|nr:hypothetical protein [Candidatus Woesebacteria bacterium]
MQQNFTDISERFEETKKISNRQKARSFCDFIEREVLLVLGALTKGEEAITTQRAREIAKATLAHVNPQMDLGDLYINTIQLNKDFPELAPVVYKVMKEYEDHYHEKAVRHVSHLIKQRQYDQAQDVVMKVLEFKYT